MLSLIFSWQTYFAINAALFLSYFLLRIVFRFAFVTQHMAQQQQLYLLRRLLAAILLIFACMPFIASLRPIPVVLDLNPIIIYTPNFMHVQNGSEILNPDPAQPTVTDLSLGNLVFGIFLLGLLIKTRNYLQNSYRLNQLMRAAFLLRRVKRVSILVTDKTDIVFCFTLFWKHYIVLPYTSLTHTTDLHMSIKHEIQHLRQRDTYWLHLFSLLTIFCYWNPVVNLWIKWCKELQEYACDEAMVLNAKNSLPDYAQCLVNAARNVFNTSTTALDVLAMNGGATSNLYRRINMLFDYKPVKRKFINAIIYGASLLCIASGAYAVNNLGTPLSVQDVNALIKPSYGNTMHITPEPEVVNELNRVRGNQVARDKMRASLQRMEQYKTVIQAEMNNRHIPYDLFAMPLIQSSFRPLPASQNRVQAAGIWQIIPSTAKNLGLVVNDSRDDRLNTELSTRAALDYLQDLYKQFRDWKLAVLGYEIGEKQLALLIKAMGTRNAWEIARSGYFNKTTQQEVTHYLAYFDSAVIILHNPGLVSA